jgi:glycosyltransferase involved in cell wall biosynthesis
MDNKSETVPLISVIIPLFNKGPYITRAINSILNQTFQNFEIIVVDDHSSDNSPAIVKSYQDSRIYLFEQDHHGVSYTRNHGVDLAKGDLIAFLDADDEWMPNHLETIIRLIEKYPDAGMYTTAYKILTSLGQITCADYKNIPDPPWEGILPDYFMSGARGSYPVNASTVVIPKEIFKAMGGFSESYWYGEDADLFGKIALKYPAAFSWEIGAIYHWDAKNRACDIEIPLDYVEPFVITGRTALLKREVPKQLIESLNDYISIKEIYRAKRNVRAGNSRVALEILKKCDTKLYFTEKMKWIVLAKIPSPLFFFLRDCKDKTIRIFHSKNLSENELSNQHKPN